MSIKVKVEDARYPQGYRLVPVYEVQFGDVIITNSGAKTTHPSDSVNTEYQSKKSTR